MEVLKLNAVIHRVLLNKFCYCIVCWVRLCDQYYFVQRRHVAFDDDDVSDVMTRINVVSMQK